jgi:hypothetical protein
LLSSSSSSSFIIITNDIKVIRLCVSCLTGCSEIECNSWAHGRRVEINPISVENVMIRGSSPKVQEDFVYAAII